jgi:hypothetical protein
MKALRKHVTLFYDFNNDGTILQNINLPFHPDEVIVRQISNTGDAGTSYLVRTNLIQDFGDAYLCHVFGTSVITPQITHALHTWTNQTYRFDFINNLGAIGSLTGVVSIHLEFVKYL